MNEKVEFDAMGLDVLKEIGNMGSAKAATALALMTGARVDIAVPECKLMSYEEMGNIYGDPEKIIACVLVKMGSDFEGYIMFAQELDNAILTIRSLANQEVNSGLDDFENLIAELEPLSEIANIMISSYVSAIAELADFHIVPTVPELCVDMLMAVMNVPALVYGEVSDSVLMLETKFLDSDIKGHFFLMPTYEAYKKLMKKLGLE